MPTEQQVMEAMNQVPDPEIPTVSIVELGMVSKVGILPGQVTVHMTPTFSGCPAIHHIKKEMEETLQAQFGSVAQTAVVVDFESGWNTNKITDEGLRKLKEFGLAPPPRHTGEADLDALAEATCPWCGSADTTMRSSFGPTLCRAIHFCFSCMQGFEQFKPL